MSSLLSWAKWRQQGWLDVGFIQNNCECVSKKIRIKSFVQKCRMWLNLAKCKQQSWVWRVMCSGKVGLDMTLWRRSWIYGCSERGPRGGVTQKMKNQGGAEHDKNYHSRKFPLELASLNLAWPWQIIFYFLFFSQNMRLIEKYSCSRITRFERKVFFFSSWNMRFSF